MKSECTIVKDVVSIFACSDDFNQRLISHNVNPVCCFIF